MRQLFVLLFFPAFLTAQSTFLKNPDIVWAAETERDFIVDIANMDDEWEQGLVTLKLMRTPKNESYWNMSYLSALVFHAIYEGKMTVYETAQCTTPANVEALTMRIDTVVTFDPETYEEKVRIFRNQIDPVEDVKGWRIKQVLYYNKKTANWNTVVEAIAPLILFEKSFEDETVELRPLFWFKPENEQPDLNNKGIVWAKTVTSGKQANTAMKMAGNALVKVVDGFQNPMQQFINIFGSDGKIPFYSTDGSYTLLSLSDRLNLISKTDTVVTFDPETYEEKVMIIRNDLNADAITSIRLRQNWYWDERKNRLSIVLQAVAPIVAVSDYEGNFRFEKPLFYRLTGKK